MNRREFASIIGLAAMSIAAKRFLPRVVMQQGYSASKKFKQWVWVGTDTHTSLDEWKVRFAAMRDAGFDAILLEVYNSHEAFYQSKHLPVAQPLLESIIPLAKEAGLEVHAWMWTMPCNVESIVQRNPEWFVVNRLGQSCVDKPAYVSYYKFLCPSRPDVWNFLADTVSELSQIDGLDGIHLDYIRYPDVILPIALQPRYHIVQDREYQQYDYCYCDVCRESFKKQSGIDPIKLRDPSSNKAWNQFRYDRITHIVNDVLLPIAHEHNKLMTAAVFPNWKNVRQEWSRWKLDGAMPMLYARFYNQGLNWIGEKTKEEVRMQQFGVPVYSGLAVDQLSADDLVKAIDIAYSAGAKGASFFAAQSLTPEKLQRIKIALKSLK